MSYRVLLPDDAAPACQGRPELFFGPEGEPAQEKFSREDLARAVCHRCPIIAACAAWAIPNEREGFWAGMSEDQRAIERRRLVAA